MLYVLTLAFLATAAAMTMRPMDPMDPMKPMDPMAPMDPMDPIHMDPMASMAPMTPMPPMNMTFRPWKMPTEPCCMPNRWWSEMLNVQGDDFGKYAMYYYVDQAKQREVTHTFDRASGKKLDTSVTDYGMKSKWEVQYWNGAQCKKTPVDYEFFNICVNKTIPQGMTLEYSGNGTMAGSLRFNAWHVRYNDLEVVISLSDDGHCLPIIEKVKEPGFSGVFLFVNVKLGFDDALLDLPAECKDASAGVVG